MDRGYSPWGCKESDTTEQVTLPLSLHGHIMGTCLRNKYIKCNKNISSYDNLDDWWHKSSSSEFTVLSSVLATLILLCSLVNDQDNKPKIANMIFFLIRY